MAEKNSEIIEWYLGSEEEEQEEDRPVSWIDEQLSNILERDENK